MNDMQTIPGAGEGPDVALPLAGKRILVVEDEALVAAMLEDMLLDLGAIVIGPAFTIAKGLEQVNTAAIDLAILDVNVRGERIDAVADALVAKGVPVVFATGYGRDGVVGVHAGRPTLAKPYSQQDLVRTVVAALG